MKTVDWRYYRLKKSFHIFPRNPHQGGGEPFICARFLKDYYRAIDRARGPLRRIVDAAVAIGFRLWLPRRARKIAAQFDLGDAWRREAIRIGAARFADPKDLALYRIEKPEDLDTYIRHYEHARISKLINPLNWTETCVLKDKTVFARRCEALGIRSPTRFAECVGGEAEVFAIPAPGEIVVKPTDGRSGVGVTILSLTEEDVADEARFRETLVDRFGTEVDWIAQERLRNHDEISPIALDAVATTRLSTMINEQGAPEIVTNVLRFAQRPGSVVDNLKNGGLMAPADFDTGELGPGCVGRGVGDFDRHPANDEPITGRKVPFWDEAKALALDAHGRGFPEYNLVGWDVAITNDGPVLIEGNGQPSMIITQRGGRRGVGGTRMGELILHHMAKAGAYDA